MTEQDALDWVDLGPYAYRLEPHTDTFFFRPQGDFDAETVRMFTDNMRRFSETRATIFILADASGLGVVPGDVRGVMAESMKTIPISAAAIFGASFAQRVLTTLADRAINLLRRSGRYETRFFKSEAEARAWLDKKRRSMASKAPR